MCQVSHKPTTEKGTLTSINIIQFLHADSISLTPPRARHPTLRKLLRPFYKPLPGIKGYQHFRFEADQPGKVFVRETPVSPEKTFVLAQTDNVLPATAPVPVPAPGMSAQRQWYLYDNIRQFVSDEQKDILCPRPSVPKTTVRVVEPSTSHSQDTGKGKGKGKGRGRAVVAPLL